MQGFPGFPDGKQRLTPVPNLFFSDLLPAIDNLAELKVTLYAFWALGQREGEVRYLQLGDFTSDPILLKAMGGSGIQSGIDTLLDGIERAVARGTFLRHRAATRVAARKLPRARWAAAPCSSACRACRAAPRRPRVRMATRKTGLISHASWGVRTTSNGAVNGCPQGTADRRSG